LFLLQPIEQFIKTETETIMCPAVFSQGGTVTGQHPIFFMRKMQIGILHEESQRIENVGYLHSI